MVQYFEEWRKRRIISWCHNKLYIHETFGCGDSNHFVPDGLGWGDQRFAFFNRATPFKSLAREYTVWLMRTKYRGTFNVFHFVIFKQLPMLNAIRCNLRLGLYRTYTSAIPQSRPPSRLTAAVPLSFDHFLLRQRALSLYRTILRTCHKLPSEAVIMEMKTYAREEFERQKGVDDLRKKRYLLSTGRTEFERLGKQVSGNARVF